TGQMGQLFSVFLAQLLYYDTEAESGGHQLPSLPEVVDGKHVKQSSNLGRGLNDICRNRKLSALLSKVYAAAISPLPVQNRVFCLSADLVHGNRDKYAVLPDVVSQFLQWLRIKEQTRVVGA